MWATHSTKLEHGRGLRFSTHLRSRVATYEDVLRGWQSEAEFRVLFNALCAKSPYSAFRQEIPPVTITTLIQPFEFVLLDSPGIAQHPDSAAFAGQFVDAPETGIVGDAILAVPCRRVESMPNPSG